MQKESSAIIWAITSSFWISLMLCGVRYLSQDYNPSMIIFWRLLFGLVFMLPWLIKHGTKSLKTSNKKLYIIRAAIGVAGMLIWFQALTMLPLPQATALSFTSPIFSTILAIIILKEIPGIRRWTAIIIGFLGVIVIIRPGIEEFNNAALLVLLATSLWSLASILVKKLSHTESPYLVTFYMCFFMLPFSIILAMINWQDIVTSQHLLWFAFLGATSNLAHISMVKAFSKSDLTLIMPFDFMRLVFIGIMAYFFFGDITNIYDILGSAIIITSSIYIAYRETKLKKPNYAKEESPDYQ
jgi:drug/metabolite transporter (DMT)-like permease